MWWILVFVWKASRAQILKQATDYIQQMTSKNVSVQKDIENIRKQNHYLRQQGKCYSSARILGNLNILKSTMLRLTLWTLLHMSFVCL